MISQTICQTLFLDINTPSINERPYTRLFTEKKIIFIIENLANESALIADSDLNEANNSYDIFSNNYIDLFNKYFPYVRQSRKSFKDKPYITRGLKVSIRTKNRLYHKYLKDPTDLNKNNLEKIPQ